jgi:MFS family permease
LRASKLFAVGLINVRWTTGQQRAGQGGHDNGEAGGGGLKPGRRGRPEGGPDPEKEGRYRWVALSNTTLSMTMATIDGSIVIIAMPAIFRGIHLDPTSPGNISYLLWMIIGYLLVTAVLVVTLGRLGDMFGRVKIYNLGFVVFTLASIALSLDPLYGGGGAIWLIGWRLIQAVGGSMLMSNSAAILTDAFPANKRGMALGVNQIAGISGQFVGLLLGGLLAAWDWRAVFWINVPIGAFGTVWAYRSLREIATTRRTKVDWAGNVTFALGAGALLAAITYGIQPYGGHSTGWTNPKVLTGLIGGAALLVVFGIIETKIAEPMFRLGLFRIRAFAAGNAASLMSSMARGGLQFMLVIWLAGIWLPLHGYNYTVTPLWAGIYMLPLTAGFLIAGPISGALSDRYGPRLFATGGLLVAAAAFTGLMLLPVNFPYWLFGTIIFFNGVGSGLFAAPNTAAIMSSVPADQRGSASGMRSTFQNSGMSLSIGIFFSLMIAGLASVLPQALSRGLRSQGVPAAAAAHASHLPPVSTLFSALLGFNPIRNLLRISGVLHKLPARNAAALTSRQYFPHLISGPFHHGLIVVFSAAIAMSVTGALISAFRGRQFYYADPASPVPAAAGGATATAVTAAVNGAAVNGMAVTGNGTGNGAAPHGSRASGAPAAGSGGAAGPDRRPAVRAPRPDDTKM